MSEKPIITAPIPKIKIYISNPQSGNDAWWLPTPYEVVDQIGKANLVMFIGGPDVTPHLYGHSSHSTTCNSITRDEVDKQAYDIATSLNLPKIGICRGAQFLCVMAGGALIQDQSNSLSRHVVRTFSRNEILVSSDHHQAQYPWNLPEGTWDLLGWTEKISHIHTGWHSSGVFAELINNCAHKYNSPIKGSNLPEIEDAYYRNINGLAIQCHPEWMTDKTPANLHALNYYRSLVLRLMHGWDKAAI
jgi:gamma-glutamyl-gamma-aminobutyrate hydrolase PuuD